jgi:hypothetical protein
MLLCLITTMLTVPAVCSSRSRSWHNQVDYGWGPTGEAVRLWDCGAVAGCDASDTVTSCYAQLT